jgi:plastocyanin
MRRSIPLFLTALLVSVSACGVEQGSSMQADRSQPAMAQTTKPAPTGETITVQMITDDKGNYFEPSQITAKRGDVLRFTLVSGVHNVNFTAERNPGISSLPAPSDLLQLPGQTYDLVVDFPAGEYGFQCDPHALLGMVGTLTVQ